MIACWTQRALLDQATQQVRLAGAGVALDQKTGGQQLFQVQRRGRSRIRRPHVDADLHALLTPFR